MYTFYRKDKLNNTESSLQTPSTFLGDEEMNKYELKRISSVGRENAQKIFSFSRKDHTGRHFLTFSVLHILQRETLKSTIIASNVYKPLQKAPLFDFRKIGFDYIDNQ